MCATLLLWGILWIVLMYNDPVKVFNEKDSCKQLEATNATSGLVNVLLFLLTEITIWITFRGNLTKLV